jgi:hypothetical protein
MTHSYASHDELMAVVASQAWANATILTGKLYDQAFTQRRNGGSSSGGFASGECNGKTVSCTIVPRCMGSGRWSSTTVWKVNGKRVKQSMLIQELCKEV